MKARIKWAENRTFIGTSGTGHSIVLGTKHGDSDATPGPSPMELVLLGTGGCSAYDVVSILEKSRQNIEDVQVEMTAERAETDPKVFVKVHLHFIVIGRGVDQKRVERAIALSVDKYCSASAMVAKSAEVTHDFEVIEAGE
ncbi:OsmC family protein [Actibacterium pelagium]|uniref:Peroxiredoxin n=1 Tax=Actibacterium pelagium TaxID=2029103 RepID=A0A917AIV5_9RHOB|nr:OsmC family protein [Actibacterium pelagium]GGE54258.1 peroxiredoxin [Actibacterium pelagium]